MNSSNLTHGPAQKVGHMRVSRKPFKRHDGDTQSTEGQQAEEESIASSGNENGNGDNEQVDDNNTEEQMNLEETAKEQINERELQERAARDMHAHAASRQHDIYSNAGNNVKQIHNSNPQPRGLSH